MEKTLESLIEVSKAINSILDLDKLLETIMDSAIEAVGVERGILFLKTLEGALQPRVARNVDKQTIVNAEEISRSIINEVASSGKYFISSNLLNDPDTINRPSVKAFSIQSILCVPLRYKDTITGTIYLDSRKATKTFTDDDVQYILAFSNLATIAIENAKLFEITKDEIRYWKDEASKRFGFEKIIYESKKMEDICIRAKSIANTKISVLLTGESGTGKELIARAIHYTSPWREKKFIPINCGALPEHILESELFGVKRGAYTGAVTDKKGLFEEADGGTLFLDEIADMQPELQAKLLRVLQDGEIRRVGDTQYRYVNVRVISATNKDIREEIHKQRFREDLYFRLCGLEISIPPLRERKEDIMPLALYFMRAFCKENNLCIKSFSDDAILALNQYPFPGNVRELENIIRKATLLSGEQITETSLGLPIWEPLNDETDSFNETTRNHIIRVLEKVDWNQTRAAEILGLNRTTLQAKMKKLGIKKI